MLVTEDGNFDTKYPRVLPQSCRGASDVCARTHTHTLFCIRRCIRRLLSLHCRPGAKPRT